MSDISLTRVKSGSTLLKKLLDKADNGDDVLTEQEIRRATNSYASTARGRPPPDQWTVDPITQETMLSTVWKQRSRGDRSIASMRDGIDAALTEIKKADTDGSGTLSPAEQKKVKTALGGKLLAFSKAHGSDPLSKFKFVAGEPVYVPRRPFVVPANATAPELVEALLQHFNANSNDNSRHGRRPDSITRFVLGRVEVRGLVKQIKKLPAPKAKAVLKELSKRIHQPDFPENQWRPLRVYVEPTAVAPLNALAKKLGVTVDFAGSRTAPGFDYY